MKTIPRYWGYVRTENSLIWRSSPHSQQDAEAEARKAAQRVSEYEQMKWVDKRPSKEEYPYGVTLREKLLEEINDEKGQLQGFITRNHGGAEVLNVRNVMFLDWDTPEKSAPLQTLFRMLARWYRRVFSQEHHFAATQLLSDARTDPPPGFWRERYPWAVDVPELKAFMSKIDHLLAKWSVRIYKTAAGYRGIVTHTLFDPTDSETLQWLKQFACDPQYIRLCQRQESFRARLTPKGVRLGLWPDILWRSFDFRYPQCGYPNTFDWMSAKLMYEVERFQEEHKDKLSRDPFGFDDAQHLSLKQKTYEEAVKVYEKAAAPFATCRYLGTVGNEFVHPEVRPILDLHDKTTKALSAGELVLA